MFRLVLIMASSLLVGAASAEEKKVALVIGNSGYAYAPKLANPVHDAAAMAFLLKDAGFDIIETRNDLRSNEFRHAIRRFSEIARDADIAVVYYAGHGIEIGGMNYLVPTDARLAMDLDVEDEAISLDRIMRALEPVRRLRLVILDACRDNPFVPEMKRVVSTRAISRGLARVEPVMSDTLVAFAAKAGSLAADGYAVNSPFTSALLKHLATPGLDVRLALGRVRDEVLERTERRQEPFVYGSLGGSTVTIAPAAGVQDARQSTSDPDLQVRRDYELAERAAIVEAWDLFLARHPVGFLADLARAQRSKLSEKLQTDSRKQVGTALATESIPKPRDLPLVSRAIISDLQRELKRVGCDPGDSTGEWTGQTRRALQRFNQYAGTEFDTKVVSPETLDAVRKKDLRICPLACGDGLRPEGGRCVKVTCAAGKVRGRDGTCHPRPQRASGLPPANTSPPATRPASSGLATSRLVVRCGRGGCRTMDLSKMDECRATARARNIGEPWSPERREFVNSCMTR